MKKEKYPFLVRLLLGVPTILIFSIFWIGLMLISSERFGKVLKQTGENFLK